jgi:integrase
MSSESSQALRRREPVSWRGERVPGLWQRRRADGTLVFEWQGRIDGRMARRSLGAASAGEAVRALRALHGRLEAGTVAAASRLTVADAVGRFLADCDSYVAAGEMAGRTRELYEQRIARCVKDGRLERRRLNAVMTADVSRVLTVLRNAGLASSTRRGYLTALSAFFRWATERKLIPRSPIDDLPRRERPAAKRKRQPRRLSATQVEALLGRLGEQFQPVATMIVYQALRVSEALGLRWRDVDFEAMELTVCGQLGRDGRRYDRTKTEASAATLKLAPAAARALKAWRHRQAARDVSLIRRDALIFTTLNGKSQSQRNVHRAIRNAAQAAGLHVDPALPKVCTHDLRGSAGSIALALGATLADVRDYLRHANVNVTSRDYVDVLEQRTPIVDRLADQGFGS